ncbi:MAG: hypothetical protein R6U69_04140 [Marinobacter sp.]|uniref:hypothetical protein n=1 Tax=Marinobacter sp. TaxID=50741 RepID=UPI0035658A68
MKSRRLHRALYLSFAFMPFLLSGCASYYSHDGASQAGCGEGIRACGETGDDVLARGDNSENIEYIRASSVPYTIYSRKTPRGRLDSRPPALDDGVCESDQ